MAYNFHFPCVGPAEKFSTWKSFAIINTEQVPTVSHLFTPLATHFLIHLPLATWHPPSYPYSTHFSIQFPPISTCTRVASWSQQLGATLALCIAASLSALGSAAPFRPGKLYSPGIEIIDWLNDWLTARLIGGTIAGQLQLWQLTDASRLGNRTPRLFLGRLGPSLSDSRMSLLEK